MDGPSPDTVVLVAEMDGPSAGTVVLVAEKDRPPPDKDVLIAETDGPPPDKDVLIAEEVHASGEGDGATYAPCVFFSVQLVAPLAGAAMVLSLRKLASDKLGARRGNLVLVLLVPVACWQVFIAREIEVVTVPALLDARANDVRAVVIAPTDDKARRNNIAPAPVRVTDRAAVEEVVALLRSSEFSDEGRNLPEWCAMLGLEYDDRTVWARVHGAYVVVRHGGWFLVERRQLELVPRPRGGSVLDCAA
jgi:hypothetical protein